MTARAVVGPTGAASWSRTSCRRSTPTAPASWGDTGAGSLVSLGLLGDDPAVVAFEAGTDLDALAVTEEEAGGVVQSRNPAVIAGTFDFEQVPDGCHVREGQVGRSGLDAHAA